MTITSDDLATVLVRFDDGARGCVTVGQVCAGHKNDLWFEVNGAAQAHCAGIRSGRTSSGSDIGTVRTALLLKDPSLLAPAARRYAHLPGGHQEAWSDAFRNVVHEVYAYIVDGRRAVGPDAAFATFEDGYRCALVVDSILESHRRGGVWTP